MEFIIYSLLLLYSCLRTQAAVSVKTNDRPAEQLSELDGFSPLPDYVVANVSNLKAVEKTSIRRRAPLLNFPLSEQDKIDINILKSKFNNEQEIVGLAAPQIGISKRIIVFKIDKEDGVSQSFPLTVWINPVYEKDGEETDVAYEQCFSVVGVTAPVRRYKYITYKATDVEGRMVQGRAEGYAARVIQHETDHLDGILFIDLVPKNKIIPLKVFYRRLEELEREEMKENQNN